MKVSEHTGEFKRPKIYYAIEVDGKTYLVGTKHRLYNLRYKMIQRCYSAKPSEYNAYQGKGIKVCDEWRNNPEAFFEWCLKNGWKKGLQLDRIDPNGNYEPSNVQMSTISENVRRAITGRKGESARNVKLNEKQVKSIKGMLANKVSCRQIAKLFDLSSSTIGNIKNGKTWSHVKG